MLVVGQFEEAAFDSVGTARRILAENRVRLFAQEELPALLEEIRTQGHVISA